MELYSLNHWLALCLFVASLFKSFFGLFFDNRIFVSVEDLYISFVIFFLSCLRNLALPWLFEQCKSETSMFCSKASHDSLCLEYEIQFPSLPTALTFLPTCSLALSRPPSLPPSNLPSSFPSLRSWHLLLSMWISA